MDFHSDLYLVLCYFVLLMSKIYPVYQIDKFYLFLLMIETFTLIVVL